VATYALCGFSNFGSIGIQLGSLGAMAPERKSDLASIALRAMIAGSAACFMTACIAGMLIPNEGSIIENTHNSTNQTVASSPLF
jgi:nucleoside permease NupC